MRVLPLLVAMPMLSACPPVPTVVEDPPARAVVSLGGVTIQQGVGQFQLSALFAQEEEETACTSEELAGCTLTVCEIAAELPVVLSSLDAGAVTVTTPSVQHTLTRGDGGSYQTLVVDDAELFLNAEELEASIAGGADVAAVAMTVVAPTRIQLTAPPLQSVNVRLTDSLPVAWSNRSAGDVVATLTDDALLQSAVCTAPAGGGVLAIPKEVIGRFAVGGGRLSLAVTSRTVSDVDDAHAVSFTTTSTVTSPTGGAGQYTVFFQAP